MRPANSVDPDEMQHFTNFSIVSGNGKGYLNVEFALSSDHKWVHVIALPLKLTVQLYTLFHNRRRLLDQLNKI